MKLLHWTFTALNSKLKYDFYWISLKITLRWVILLLLIRVHIYSNLLSAAVFTSEGRYFCTAQSIRVICPAVNSLIHVSSASVQRKDIDLKEKKKLFTAFRIAVIWGRTIPFLKNEMHWERKDAALTSHVVMNRIEARLVGTRVHPVIRTSVGGVRERSISYIIIRADTTSLWERSETGMYLISCFVTCQSLCLFCSLVSSYLKDVEKPQIVTDLVRERRKKSKSKSNH